MVVAFSASFPSSDRWVSWVLSDLFTVEVRGTFAPLVEVDVEVDVDPLTGIGTLVAGGEDTVGKDGDIDSPVRTPSRCGLLETSAQS